MAQGKTLYDDWRNTFTFPDCAPLWEDLDTAARERWAQLEQTHGAEQDELERLQGIEETYYKLQVDRERLERELDVLRDEREEAISPHALERAVTDLREELAKLKEKAPCA